MDIIQDQLNNQLNQSKDEYDSELDHELDDEFSESVDKSINYLAIYRHNNKLGDNSKISMMDYSGLILDILVETNGQLSEKDLLIAQETNS